MFVKRFKRKCDVRGCKNTTNVYLISKRREMGNTIAICTDCLKEAQTSIDGYVEEKKVVFKANRPLFPHPELKVTLSSVADTTEPKPTEVIDKSVTKETHMAVAEDAVTINNVAIVEEVENKPTPKAKTTSANTKKPNNAKKK